MRVIAFFVSIILIANIANAADAPNPTDITVTNRNGQTFITWTDPLTSTAGQVLRYRVYRYTSQITDTASATLIGDNILNNSGQSNTIGFTAANRINESLPMSVIDEGASALPLWTGLFVYTPTASQTAYYAVVAYDPAGTTYSTPSPLVSGENAATTGTIETAGGVVPVLKRANTYGTTGWDSNSGHPLMLSLHASSATGSFSYGESSTVGDLYAYWGDTTMSWQDGYQSVFAVWQDRTVTPNRIVLYPRDTVWNMAGTGSLETMWCGLSTTLLGGSSPNKVYPFTEYKLDTLVPWVSSEYGVDVNRIYATGGSMGAWGSVSYAFHRPDVFAAVFPDRPKWRQRTIADTTSGSNTTATESSPLMGDEVTTYYTRNDSVAFITAANAANDPLPPVAWGIGRNDGYATFAEQTDAVAELRDGKRWFCFAWDNGNHSTSTASSTAIPQYRDNSSFSKNISYPVFTNSSIDDDPETDLSGCINCGWSWDIVSDNTTQWSASVENNFAGTVSVDITPRNTQIFSISPGEVVGWSASTGQSGNSTADSMGLVTAIGVNILQGEATTLTFTATHGMRSGAFRIGGSLSKLSAE